MTGDERFFPQVEKPYNPRVDCDTARATVSIARTVERFRDQESIHALVQEALAPLGGIGAFVKKGQRVLLKPNLTGYFLADEGKTTDPRVVASLVRLCREAGAVEVVVGEGSGMEDTDVVFRSTGMRAAVRAAGGRCVSFDDCEYREVEVPRGKVLRRIALPVPLLDADVIVNVCKGKTHHMDPITGAIKNWVGCIGLERGRQQHHDTDCFEAFVDVMSVTRPALNVCDAIVIGEGDGPVANTPRWCGCVLASTDPVALDVTICRLFSLDPMKLRFAQEGAARGLGSFEVECIDVVGATLEEALVEVRRPRQGWDYFPFNVIVGGGVTYAGTLGHWKSIADAFLADGTWVEVLATRGTPTFLIGDAEDPDFEKHAAQGPYFVVDDVAPDRYRRDPRVVVIPGHPALHNMLPKILEGLRLTVPGRATQKAQELFRAVESRLLYVPRTRIALEVAGLAALGVGAGLLGWFGLRRARVGLGWSALRS
ncbi:MAG: DUF362 domain-containing protein [Planctomycetota bacterium]